MRFVGPQEGIGPGGVVTAPTCNCVPGCAALLLLRCVAARPGFPEPRPNDCMPYEVEDQMLLALGLAETFIDGYVEEVRAGYIYGRKKMR